MLKRLIPRSIRTRIILSTAAITLGIAAVTVSICYTIFQSFLRKAEIQSAEFNLQVISNNVAADMDGFLSFADWCCVNTEIHQFLNAFRSKDRMPAISSQDNAMRSIALNSYDRLKEEYNNTPSSDNYVPRVLISTENRKLYLQISDTSATNTSHAAEVLFEDPVFQTLLNAPVPIWNGLHTDPLRNDPGELYLPIARPIYSQYNTDRLGWVYLAVSDRVISDNMNAFPLESDSSLYITIGDHTYLYEDGSFRETELVCTPVKDLSKETFHDQTTAQLVELPDRSSRYLVTCPLGNQGWTITQILSDRAYLTQRNVYNQIIAGIVVFILIGGLFSYFLLNRIINRPVRKLQDRIQAIAQGDFSRDPSIEWPDEFGAIGTGINRMSEDVVTLMNKKVEDEKQKKDLEYQILQSQINPHFLYNTLNSIKWMATIQGASGIGEMTTALARLMKNVSKGTAALIPLKEELDLVNDYFLIQQYRYGGSISIEYQIEDDALYRCLLHRFTLQPIVENALFHGIEPKGCAGKILIRAWTDGGQAKPLLRISVTDNGIGMTEDTIRQVLSGDAPPAADFFRHVGINNVNKRIQYDFGEDCGITIDSKPGVFTTMTITLPYILSERDLLR